MFSQVIIHHIKPHQSKIKSTEVAFLMAWFFYDQRFSKGDSSISITGKVLEMQIPRPHSRPTESGTLRVGPSSLCFNKSSRCFLKTTILGPDLMSGISTDPQRQMLKLKSSIYALEPTQVRGKGLVVQNTQAKGWMVNMKLFRGLCDTTQNRRETETIRGHT